MEDFSNIARWTKSTRVLRLTTNLSRNCHMMISRKPKAHVDTRRRCRFRKIGKNFLLGRRNLSASGMLFSFRKSRASRLPFCSLFCRRDLVPKFLAFHLGRAKLQPLAAHRHRAGVAGSSRGPTILLRSVVLEKIALQNPALAKIAGKVRFK